MRICLLSTALAFSGCAKLLGAAESEVEQKVRRAAAGKEVVPTEPPAGNRRPMEINSLRPARGETTGGLDVEIIGLGFPHEVTVLFGAAEADPDFIQVLPGETSILVRTPPYEAPGVVTVRVLGPESQAALMENAFEYYDPVRLDSVTPSRGPSHGGTLVALLGQGFLADTVVQFGDADPIAASYIDGHTLTVSTPALGLGTFSVTVSNTNGSDTLDAAFTTFAPVRVARISPVAGPLAGGNTVSVHGTGLVDPTAVKFGSQSALVTGRSAEARVDVTVPAAMPRLEGSVAVTAQNGNGDDTLAGAYIYYDAADERVRLVGLAPQAGPITGGILIYVAAVGLTGAELTATIGSTEVDCTRADAYTLSCPLPPGPEGRADVTVSDGEHTATLAEGFKYVDLRFEGALPDEGAIAGGTYVRLFGNGFGPGTRVFFDERPAADLTVVNEEELTLWTPPGAEGPVAVRVESWGMEVTEPDAFTYFNPLHAENWTSGGEITGAINVTVVNSRMALVENALVLAGDAVDPQRPHLHGYTNSRGQVTLSDPSLIGPQTVHAGKSGHGAFSWVQVNARNLLMKLTADPPPPPDPLPECPEANGGPPLIRGKIKRIKDKYNTGNDLVVVTTTYDRQWSPMPDPGPDAQLVSQGDFALLSRTGDLTVIALAGKLNAAGNFEVATMGFHPYLFTQASSTDACTSDDECGEHEACVADYGVCLRVYGDVEIVIDTPLDQPMEVKLDNPPLKRLAESTSVAPTETQILVWYDFGQRGYHPIGYLGAYNAQAITFDMPSAMPAHLGEIFFSVKAGVYAAGGNLPRSEVFIPEVYGTDETVLATPMLKTHVSTSPGLGVTGDPMVFNFDLRPTDIPTVEPSANYHAIFDVEYVVPCRGAMPMPQTLFHWEALSPGLITNFNLPVFPAAAAGANPPRGTHYWFLMSLLAPGVESFNEMSFGEVADWRSNAAVTSALTTP
jgi:hypothetical protein